VHTNRRPLPGARFARCSPFSWETDLATCRHGVESTLPGDRSERLCGAGVGYSEEEKRQYKRSQRKIAILPSYRRVSRRSTVWQLPCLNGGGDMPLAAVPALITTCIGSESIVSGSEKSPRCET
jgi:hypothetical protein